MFVQIMHAQNLKATDLLVTGDDLNSEIKAATDLGIDAVLYDRNAYYPNKDMNCICSFADLKSFL
ncbi:MAG: hypothetical protein HC905_26650 [Bacteroidales bacterium]|nr:hypothetical protein [Bacteroidales bacterium]